VRTPARRVHTHVNALDRFGQTRVHTHVNALDRSPPPRVHTHVNALTVPPTLRSHECERGTQECVRHDDTLYDSNADTTSYSDARDMRRLHAAAR
jgi:hypothetical protein